MQNIIEYFRYAFIYGLIYDPDMFYVEMSCSLCLCENEELVYCFNPCIRFSFTLHVTPRVKAGSDVGEQRSCGSYST